MIGKIIAIAGEEIPFGQGVLVAILGALLVFCVLVLLVFVVTGIKAAEPRLEKIFIKGKEKIALLFASKKKEALIAGEKKEAIEAAPAVPLLTSSETTEDTDAEEEKRIVAAITAAVALISEQTFGVYSKAKFVVRDIRKL
ncbi:MAG: hypothetical protein LBT20_06450 [Clostridiales bacterium]|jgi:Na+-transporting methylmalonyl-CoA/oxaloacetate decarboxylase gamma subunit|nr:hypothetical protein [Clostridiales bacterium]